jgi:hypothetical protein
MAFNDYGVSPYVYRGSHGPSKAPALAYNPAVPSAEPQRGGRWWKQKQVLHLFFCSFLGIGVGIGHHFYYAALDGRRGENQAVWKASYFLPSYRNFRAKNPNFYVSKCLKFLVIESIDFTRNDEPGNPFCTKSQFDYGACGGYFDPILANAFDVNWHMASNSSGDICQGHPEDY